MAEVDYSNPLGRCQCDECYCGMGTNPLDVATVKLILDGIGLMTDTALLLITMDKDEVPNANGDMN